MIGAPYLVDPQEALNLQRLFSEFEILPVDRYHEMGLSVFEVASDQDLGEWGRRGSCVYASGPSMCMPYGLSRSATTDSQSAFLHG